MQKQKMLCVNAVRRWSMPDISQPVPMSFILETIAAIFAVVAIGIWGVKKGKSDAKK